MFGRKAKLELAVKSATVEMLSEQIITLKQEKADLVIRLDRLQDALVAKEAPEAYRDRITPADVPMISKQAMVDTKVMQSYMEELRSDRPTFDSVDDLIELVGSVRGVPQSRSIHGNDES